MMTQQSQADVIEHWSSTVDELQHSLAVRDRTVQEQCAQLEQLQAELAEQKRLTEVLRESEHRWRQLVETCPEVVFTVDPDGNILIINRSYPGYPPVEEVIGTHVNRWVPVEQQPFFQETLTFVLETGETRSYEIASKRPDGGEDWWLTRMGPVCVQGRIVAATVVTSNITARRRNEDNIRRAHEARDRQRCLELAAVNASLADEMSFAGLRAAIGDAMNVGNGLQAGLRPTCEMLVRHFDAVFARIWTLNPATNVLELQASCGLYTHLDGPHARIPVGHFKIGRIAEQCQPHLTNEVVGDPAIHDQDWAKREGIVSFAGYPLVVERRVVGVLGMFSRHPLKETTLTQLATVADVVAQFVQRVRAEEEIRRLNAELEERISHRTVELEAANKEMEAFCYSVSHDLRAPLRALDGFSEILFRNFAAQLPPEAARLIGRVRNNAQQMGQLIDDLLAFSRLSRQALHQQTVNMRELVRRAWDDLSAERGGRQVEFRVGELPTCQGDPGLLKQVFMNILSNALKYSRKRNSAIIEVGSRPGELAGERVYFVKDNGVGFDMRYAHKLFGVFQRLHRAEDYEGTGVGLALVQRIIHRHDGRIWATAEPDGGATFSFTLKGK